jgi:hypothetical protein
MARMEWRVKMMFYMEMREAGGVVACLEVE